MTEMANKTEATARWTPMKGIRRAAVAGFVVSVVLSVVVGVLAAYAEALMMNAYFLTAFTVFIAWCLFLVIQSAAGMVGRVCTAMAVGYTMLILLTRNAVWAELGARGGENYELISGWDFWFHPIALLFMFLFPAIGLIFSSWLFRDGTPGSDFFGSILSMRVVRID